MLLHMDPAELLDMIRETFPTLDRWGRRLADGYVPASGSDLAVDDEDWTPSRASQMALMGLGSARDHLHAVRVLIEARQLFPYAQLSLIRGALIGSSQAVWLLSPTDSSTRVERARLIAKESYAMHGKFLAVLRKLAPESTSRDR